MKLFTPAICMLIFILAAPAEQARPQPVQQITLRLLDPATGAGIANQIIRVRFAYADAGRRPELEVQTNAHGSAQIALPIPPPTGIYLDESKLSGLMPCGYAAATVVGNIAAQGALGPLTHDCTAGSYVRAMRRSPGTIVLFARPFSLWERLTAFF